MKIKFLLLVYIYIIPTIISISNIVSTVLKFLLIFIVIPYWKLKNVHVINFLFLNFNYRILRSPFILWIHFENLRFVSIDWTLGLARRSESENVGIFIHFYTFAKSWKDSVSLFLLPSGWYRNGNGVPWLRSAIRLRSIAPASARKSYIISWRGCDRSTGRAS